MITPGYYLAKKAQENASDVSMTFLKHLKNLYMSLANILLHTMSKLLS